MYVCRLLHLPLVRRLQRYQAMNAVTAIADSGPDNIVPLYTSCKNKTSWFQVMVKHKKKIDMVRKYKQFVL